MKRLYQYIFSFFIPSFFLQSCSFLGQYSTYQSVRHQSESSFRDIFNEADYQKINKNRDTKYPKFIPQGFRIITFGIEDSTIFEMEEFLGGKVLSCGPAYIPIIPNILYPFAYLSNDNKKKDYHILIFFAKYSTMNINDLKFYRNKKEIDIEIVEILGFNDSTNSILRNMYTVIDRYEGDSLKLIMLPNKYYLLTFKLRKFTTKEIEIKYREELFFQIRRKKKLSYKPLVFAS